MAYPTPPVLDPIAGTATPNLTTGGPYDEVLNKIEAYFAQLGAYVDAQIAAVRGEIPSTTDFATAEQLEAVKKSASDAASAAATAQEAAEAAQTTARDAQGSAEEASASVATLEGTVGKITRVNVDLPTVINGGKNNVLTINYSLFNPDGSDAGALRAIACVFKNILLATPNDDRTALFGYLGDNTQNLSASVSVKSSAALTAAYEAGGITKSSSDPVFTSADLATCKVSAEGVPYREE